MVTGVAILAANSGIYTMYQLPIEEQLPNVEQFPEIAGNDEI